jgi:ATP-dependent DNA helicase RecQ
VLYGNKPVKLVSYETIKTRIEATKKKRKERFTSENPDDVLFEKLRLLRKSIADDEGKPAFTVFADTTLKQMAEQKPTNILQLLDVSGVGEHKAKTYGDVFLNEIAEYIATSKKKKNVKEFGGTQNVSYALFQQNKSISEIALERNLSEYTIISHLAEKYKLGEPIDALKFVTDEVITKVAKAKVEIKNTDQLKPYFEYFNGEIDYGKIRFALAYLEKNEMIS